MATSPPPDTIGDASARLFAMGVDGPQRLVALRFLGILLGQAGDDGRVHADPDDLVGLGILQGMQPAEVGQSRSLLESAGVLERESTGWFIRNFAPVGDEVPPADAMAAIARVLGRDDVEQAPAPAEAPVPVAASVASVTSAAAPEPPPDITPVPEPSHSRFSPRWVAAPAGIAAAILVVALVLSGQVRLNLPGQTASNNREDGQQVTSESPAPSSELGTSTLGSTPEPSAPGPTKATAGSAPASTAPTASATSSPGPACPLGAVLVAVESVEQGVDGSVPQATPRLSASIPPIVRTTASGVLRNTSTVPAVATPFPVEVTFTDGSGRATGSAMAIALTGPVTVAPGQTVAWSVAVDNPDRTPFPTGAKAGALNWRWEDQALAATCPH